MKISLHNTDCMSFMRELPDNHFNLAIVVSVGGML